LSKSRQSLIALGCVLLALGCVQPVATDKTPPPSTSDKLLWLIVVTDESTTGLVADAGYWKSVQDRGHKYRIYSNDSPDGKKYGRTVEAVGPPAVIVIDQKSQKPITTVTLPNNKKQVDLLIKRSGGK